MLREESHELYIYKKTDVWVDRQTINLIKRSLVSIKTTHICVFFSLGKIFISNEHSSWTSKGLWYYVRVCIWLRTISLYLKALKRTKGAQRIKYNRRKYGRTNGLSEKVTCGGRLTPKKYLNHATACVFMLWTWYEVIDRAKKFCALTLLLYISSIKKIENIV